MSEQHRLASIRATARLLRDAVDPWVPEGSRVALLDFPHHSNVGDSAIWTGELAYLRRRGATIVHRCSWRTYEPDVIRRRIGGDGVVLLNGGGNFGDLYVRHHALRERVLTDFTDHRVVQLPQTVNFSTAAALDTFTRRHGARDNLVVLVRDHESAAVLRGRLAVEPVLSPDMVFALGPLPRPRPERDTVALLRTDQETAGFGGQGPVAGVVPEDWIGERWDGDRGGRDRVLDLGGRVRKRLRGPAAPAAASDRFLGLAMDARARSEVRRGCAQLGAGRVVITDRLHAHLLSHLMGIPHVVLADAHAKVTRASELWVGEQGHIGRAADLAEATAWAAELRASGQARP